MERLQKNNIILIGFMGSGKTSVGRLLAERLDYRFLDMDRMIEHKENMTIPEIFELMGEDYFRDKETGLLKELMPDLEAAVLSTGGGIPLREQNRELLKQMGFVIYLKASKETTVNRLKGDTSRPLLMGEELEQRVERLQRERLPIYTGAAHYIVDTDKLSPNEIVEVILTEFLQQPNVQG